MPRKRTTLTQPSKFEWLKKNIVIVPVVAAIIAGTFTSVRYVLSLTDTITANQETILKLQEKNTASESDIYCGSNMDYGRKFIQTISRHSKRSHL